MVEQGLAELVDVVAEVLVVQLAGLEEREQRLVALVVLLLAVLGLLLVDRVLALELGVDLALLGLAVGHEQLGDLLAQHVAVVLVVAEVAQEGLEASVVIEDQLDDIALLWPRDRGGVGVAHALNVSSSASLAPRGLGVGFFVMTPEQMLEHCLAKPGAWPDDPWGEHPVAKVHDKIFAFIGDDNVGVKSGPTRDVADEWLDRYPDNASVMAYIGRSGWNNGLRRRHRGRGAARGRRRVLPAGGRQAGQEAPAAGLGGLTTDPHAREFRCPRAADAARVRLFDYRSSMQPSCWA